MKKNTLLAIGLLSVISFGAITLTTYANAPKPENTTSLSRAIPDNETSIQEDSTEAISIDEDIPYYYNTNEIESDWTTSLKTTLENKLNKIIDNIGFIYYDLTSGEKITINQNEIVVAASTYKVGMNILAYESVKNNELSLDEELLYNSSHYFGGTGILQGEIDGKLTEPINIQELLDLSIIYSDNIATNMVFDRLGGKQLAREQMNNLVGLTCITEENRTTPEIQYRLLRFIYEHRDEENYAHLIDIMKNTVFHDRMDKYIPEEDCAHKIGSYESAINDIGIVHGETPYIFVMYTDGVSNAEEVIATTSKLVYDAHQDKYE